MITCVLNSHELRRIKRRRVHEVPESQSKGAAHYTSSLINHQGTETLHNRLLIDSPLVACRRHECRLYLLLARNSNFISSLRGGFFFCHLNFNPHLFGSNHHQHAVYCLFSPVCCSPNPGWSDHITVMHTCTSVRVLPSGHGFSFRDVRPFEVTFSTHALWRVIPLPLRFNLGTQARPAAGQRLYKQRLGVAALSVLLMEGKPVWFLRVFHIFVS